MVREPRVQHPYECQAKGHQGDTQFYDAPPDYWSSKGMTPPKNCQTCRSWVKAQEDSVSRCTSCGRRINVPRNKKISIHKRVGPYVDPAECDDCENENRPPQGVAGPKRERRKRQDEQRNPNRFKDLKTGVAPVSRPLAVSGPFFARPIVNRELKMSESREMHLLHHVPGSRYDLTTYAHLRKTPTSLTFGTTLPVLLSDAQAFMRTTDTETVREYEDRDRIIRVTYRGDDSDLEFSILEKTSDGTYGLVTTFTVDYEYVTRQRWYDEY